MSYINKIQKGSQEYDINDTRIAITAADAGKYLQVQNDGTLAWAEVQGGGSGTIPEFAFDSGNLTITITTEQINNLIDNDITTIKLVDSGEEGGEFFVYRTLLNDQYLDYAAIITMYQAVMYIGVRIHSDDKTVDAVEMGQLTIAQ